MLNKRALARSLRHTLLSSAVSARLRNEGAVFRQREQAMDFGRISRRHVLQGGAALALGSTIGARSAFAADTTIGFIYVGSRDDYG